MSNESSGDAEPSFSSGSARNAGVTEKQLRASGLHRIARGWYSAVKPKTLRHKCHLFLPFLPDNARFSDITAAALLNLPLPPPGVTLETPLHVTLPREATVPRRAELVVHRRTLSTSDFALFKGLPIVAAPRLFCDLATSLPLDGLVALGDAIVRDRRASLQDLEERIEAAPWAARRGRIRLALTLLDGRALSPAESLLRVRLRNAGIEMTPHYEICDSQGSLLGRVTLAAPHSQIGIDLVGDVSGPSTRYTRHSYADHADDDELGDKYTAFAEAGWLIFRAFADDLEDNSRRLIAQVEAARIRSV